MLNSSYDFWVGLFLPVKTSRDIAVKLHAEAGHALQAAPVRERLATLGVEPMPMSLEQFAAYFRSDVLAHVKIVQAANNSGATMTDVSEAAEHYGRPGLGDAILGALKAAGKDVDNLTPDDLAPLDEFHTRGRIATVELAQLLSLQESDRVLDIGCGIGGPSRYLANTFGCRVVGLRSVAGVAAASPRCCRGAPVSQTRLSTEQGDALALPFADQSFDVVWSQNMVMNIADRGRLYGEIWRVLKAGGRYAFADVVAGNGGMPHFPVPWAHDPSGSALLSADETRSNLAVAGFRIIVFQDQTDVAVAQQAARIQAASGPSALGVHILLGADGLAMLKNSVRNFEERRIGLVQGVAMRPR